MHFGEPPLLVKLRHVEADSRFTELDTDHEAVAEAFMRYLGALGGLIGLFPGLFASPIMRIMSSRNDSICRKCNRSGNAQCLSCSRSALRQKPS